MMAMTKEKIRNLPYEIALAISTTQTMTGDPPGWEFDFIVSRLATYFRASFPEFDRAAFIAACHIHSTSMEEWERRQENC